MSCRAASRACHPSGSGGMVCVARNSSLVRSVNGVSPSLYESPSRFVASMSSMFRRYTSNRRSRSAAVTYARLYVACHARNRSIMSMSSTSTRPAEAAPDRRRQAHRKARAWPREAAMIVSMSVTDSQFTTVSLPCCLA
jgi:hypothetical protein